MLKLSRNMKIHAPTIKNTLFIITFTVLFSSLLLYLPFLLKSETWLGLKIPNSDMHWIYRNFDGPLYIVPAKTWYDPKKIAGLKLETNLSPKYFAAHLPGYPAVIALFAPLLGYLRSMIFVVLASTVGLALFFYYFLREFKLSENPLLLTVVMLFLPRLLVVRSVGAPESLFMLLVLGSLFFFEKKKYVLSGIAGALAVATKSPGILLIFGYGLVALESFIKTRKVDWKMLWLLLIPVGLIGVFYLYFIQYGDFYAYFHTGGYVPMPYPFAVFNSSAQWVGDVWLEEIILYFFLYLLAILNFKDSKYRSFFYFGLVFFTATVFVQHKDISRYSLPLWPLALISFERFFTSKRFLLALVILLPGIYLFAWNFLLTNVLPVSNWAPYL